jgi:hypothetical protein
MMHSYSPSSRQLAVQGIGFPPNISVGSDVLDLAAFRDWSDDRFDAPSQPIDRIAWLPCRGHGLRPGEEIVVAVSEQPVASLACYR